MPLPRALQPRWWAVHLLALVAVTAAAWLGLWQYDAWQTRREAEAVDLTRAEPVPIPDVMGPDDPFPGDRVGQPVTLEGRWVPSGTVYVAGRTHDGADGYWVVTPLALGTDDAPAVLVVRGWSPTPTAPPTTGPATVTGWLQPPEGTGERDSDPIDDVLPQLRIADAVQHVDQDLYGAYVVAAAPTAGLEPADLEQLPEAGRFTAVRNLLYAFEWWVFGLFALFVWWRWLRDEVLAATPDAAAVDAPAVR